MANHLSYEVLNRSAEGRTSASEGARAQRHLARCGRCRSEHEWLQRLRHLPTRGFRDALAPADDTPPSRARINADWLARPA